jgi:hypothetical protein
MMHYSSAVITLRELPSKKVLREYNHSRKGETSEVFCNLTFGSEYAIGYKFTDGLRRRLELSIDGALVTRNLILEGEGTLERFVDSDKRFKFVSADHASVADPTSPDNGSIEIKLFMEAPQIAPILHFTHPWIWRGCPTYEAGGQVTTSNAILRGSYLGHDGATCSDSIQCSNSAFNSTLLSMQVTNCSSSYGGVGATIEGSKSNQEFGSTVWRGDLGSPTVFRFRLRGVTKFDAVMKDAAVVKQAIECPFCHVFSKKTARFCADCGAEFVKAVV